MTSRILIAYSDPLHQLEFVIPFMLESLRSRGYAVDVGLLQDIPPKTLEQYDGVILADWIQRTRHSPALRRWIKSAKPQLKNLAAGLILLTDNVESASLAEYGYKGHRETIESLVRKTGWYPTVHAFARKAFQSGSQSTWMSALTKRFHKRDLQSLDSRPSQLKSFDQLQVESFLADFIIELEVRDQTIFDFALAQDL